jgi:Domain of unknown function (DUF309)
VANVARRTIIEGDALAWMDAHPAEPGMSVVTSLPDTSELPGLELDAWRAWFVETARRVVRWVPEDAVAIFYQSDIRQAGVWIDKGYLVMRAAEEERAHVLWHKIVCRKPPGTVAPGRPSYSHMIALSRTERGLPRKPGPDVLPDAGFMPWSRAMGVEACRVACAYLRDETSTRTVVDPFCGRGTVLAVANAVGFDAVGVDLSAKRCRSARALVVGAGGAGGAGGESAAKDAVLGGAALFDAGAYFEAHEVWEGRWREEKDALHKQLLHGLVQTAAAFHKLLVMQSPEAATRLLARGLSKLDACPESLAGLDLASLRDRLRAVTRGVAAGDLDAASVPRIHARP